MRILILNGPNLNMLGNREPEHYGSITLSEIENNLRKNHPNQELTFFQSNSESDIIEILHKSSTNGTEGVVANFGAFTHYSYAIRDAIALLKIPVIEVHISNVFGRDDFRRESVVAPVCKGVIAGFGAESYELAISYLVNHK